MATIQIRKKSSKTWVHIDSVLGQFILSKFYVSADGAKFQIVEQGESKRRIYDVVDISLFDDTQGGLIEVFTDVTSLLLRLEQLQYPAFDTSNMPVSSIDTTATHWKGNYDIITNNPPLSDGIGQIGDERKCTTAGSRDFGSGILDFNTDDIIAYNGLIYFKKVNNSQGVVMTASHYKGKFNATTNALPTLINGIGQNGDYYDVRVAGTTDFGAGAITFVVGDWIHYDGFAGEYKKWFSPSAGGIATITHTQLTYTSSPIFTIPQNAQIISVVINELRHLKATKYTYNPLLAINNFEITDPTFLLDWEAGTEIEIITQ